jgi:hypothetical protein
MQRWASRWFLKTSYITTNLPLMLWTVLQETSILWALRFQMTPIKCPTQSECIAMNLYTEGVLHKPLETCTLTLTLLQLS